MLPVIPRAIKLAVLALVAVVLLLGIAQVRSCQLQRQKAAEARLDKHQDRAVVESSKDAIATQEGSAAREQASEQVTRENREEIINAQGADVVVHPNVSDAGMRALCRRDAYRNSERCRLLAANPR